MSIHPTALVDQAAKLGSGVTVGPFTIIHGNVEIGDGTVIESHCEIGHPTPLADGRPLIIGNRSLIRSHSVFYEGSSFGPELTTGHHVTVRDGTRAGRGLQVGGLGDIQGDCQIGDFVRTQSNVIIGKATVIEDFVWLFPRVACLNDPTPPSETLLGAHIERFAVICAHSVLLPGVRIGEGAMIGAGSIVSNNIDPHRIACGIPIRDKGETSRLKLKGSRLPAYPWTRHFHRGYPPEVVEQWVAQIEKLAA